MAILSGYPTSRRRYVSLTELAQYIQAVISDSSAALVLLEQAEEIIDSYIGPQDKAFKHVIDGVAQSGTTTTFTLQADHASSFNTNELTYCEVEIVGGSQAGQRKPITANTAAGVVTTEAFTGALDDTSYYKISQVGKFPRRKDVVINRNNNTYLKYIPEEIKRATAAQYQYMVEMGASFFSSDQSSYNSETIDDYSYSKGNGNVSAEATMIASKAKTLLRGLLNRRGTFTAE